MKKKENKIKIKIDFLDSIVLLILAVIACWPSILLLISGAEITLNHVIAWLIRSLKCLFVAALWITLRPA